MSSPEDELRSQFRLAISRSTTAPTQKERMDALRKIIDLAPQIAKDVEQKGNELEGEIREILATAPPAELGKQIAALFYANRPTDKE